MHVANFGFKDFVLRRLCDLCEIFDYAAHHPVREMNKLAIEESVRYVTENMLTALGLYTPGELLKTVLQQIQEGLILEFGVYRGGSIRFIARRLPDRTIHGFDSFVGLPEAWSGFRLAKGAFNLKGRLPRVPNNVVLHSGFFDISLPKWKQSHAGDIALLHIDCDLYSSTKIIFDQLGDRLRSGTIIVFDEYFGYPQWRHHEFRAFQEFVQTSGLHYEYICYARRQVAIRIL